MVRRHKDPREHRTLTSLAKRYEEVLRLRQEILIAETDQDAADLPSDLRRVAAGQPCARSAPDQCSEPIE